MRADAVSALDDALGRVGRGAQVMHAMDPSRLLSFEHGGDLSSGPPAVILAALLAGEEVVELG